MAAGNDQELRDRRARLTLANPVSSASNFSSTETFDVIEIDGDTGKGPAGMRIQFHVTKTLKKEPNTSEVTVSNLSPTTRKSIQRKGVRVQLEAGYKNGITRIFSGDARTIDHIRRGGDFDTMIRLGDGERSWQFARVYESFAPGARIADAIRTGAKALGVNLGNLEDAVAGITGVFDAGWSMSGPASRAFDQLMRSVGLGWSVQDGELQILAPGTTAKAGDIPEVSEDTGLVGSPEMGTPKKAGKPALVKFTSLLIPMRPGQRVRLKSERYDGDVRIESCVFQGDTNGGPWYTEMQGTIIG